MHTFNALKNNLVMNAPNAFISRNDDNSTILQRVARGEKSAFEECFKTYKNLIWKIARKYTKTNQDAEDAVQDVFLSIWKNAARFDPSLSPEWAFIGLVAQRSLISNYRKSRHRHSDVSLTDFDLERQLSNSYEKIHLRLELKPVIKAMNKLSSSEIKLIKLSILAGNSHTEISNKIGMPLGTVKSRIKRGLDKIRRSVNYSGKPVMN